MTDTKNTGKWKNYTEEFVKILNAKLNYAFYGKIISTDEEVTSLLPYLDPKYNAEGIIYWGLVTNGKPLIIRDDEISLIIPTTQKNIGNIVSRLNLDNEIQFKRSRLETLSTELELPKMEKEYQKRQREENE